MNSQKSSIINWLEKKIFKRESGIIIDAVDQDRFNNIHNFLEIYDHPFQTPVIYYEAFAEEDPQAFLNTLMEEIGSKLKPSDTNYSDTLDQTIEKANLKMVIIDHCHRHSVATLEIIMKKLYAHNISLVLSGTAPEMRDAQIMNHPAFMLWDRINFHPENSQQALASANPSCRK